jgi:hypothetical protein
MTSTVWMDLGALVAENECHVVAVEGDPPVPPEDVASVLERSKSAAAVRLATVIGGDQKMVLMLQGLPQSADYLLGRPAFRG